MILQDPIEAGQQRRGGPCSSAIKNTNRNESHRFRDAEVGSADDARHMRSMTVAVDGASGVLHGIEARSEPAPEIDVRRDAGIDNIDVHTGSRSAAHITAVQWERPLIDSIQSPWRRRDGNSC